MLKADKLNKLFYFMQRSRAKNKSVLLTMEYQFSFIMP